MSAYVRPGGATRARGVPARHERLRAGRGRADAAAGALERGLLAAAGRGQARGDGRDGDGRRRRARASRSTARSIRSDARLTYGEVDERVRRRARAPRSPWGEPLDARARGGGARCASARERGSLEVESSEPTFEFDDGRPRDGRAPRGADRVAPPDRAADDPRERAGGRLPGRRAGCRRSTACTSGPTRSRSTFLVEQLASLDVPTPPLPKQMTPQQAADAVGRDQPHGRARRARAGTAARTRRRSCCAR